VAKPFLDRAGNGFHVHFSLLDREGRNVFDNGTADGSEVMRHAVGGLLSMTRPTSLIFAPHRNSYRRLTPNAPRRLRGLLGLRGGGVRIPGGANAARRVEHRVAGADANPYLVLAAVLGAALEGIENRIEPPEPMAPAEARRCRSTGSPPPMRSSAARRSRASSPRRSATPSSA
jgi:glutamine synthetase